MSYRIDYAPAPKPGSAAVRSGSRRSLLTAAFFALFTLLVHAFWQEGAVLLRRLLFGTQGESVLACFEGIARSLGDGLSLHDAAVGAFRDVLYGH